MRGEREGVRSIVALAWGSCLLVGAWAPAVFATEGRAIEVQEAPFRAFGRSVTARFLVDASPRQAFETLTDYASMADYMPMVEEATVLEAREGWVKVRFRVKVLGMFDLREVDERTMEPYHRIRWHAVEGPLKASDGSWTFVPEGARTRVVYQTDVDPGIPLPPALLGFLLKRGLLDYMEGVRSRIERRGAGKKKPWAVF